MSLQVMEAVLVELDSEGNVTSEQSISLELVQKGDILKVRLQTLAAASQLVSVVLLCFYHCSLLKVV